MKKEWTPHIIAVTAFVVFIVLGLACASVPPYSLSQAEMRLDDPRMPPDRFDSKGRLQLYWLGSQGAGLSADQVSILRVYKSVYNLSVDGNRVTKPKDNDNYLFLYLTPGKHSLTFSYYGRRNITAYNGAELGYVDIDLPNSKMEIDMKPGKIYTIDSDVSTALSPVEELIVGKSLPSRSRYSASLKIEEYSDRYGDFQFLDFHSYTPPALQLEHRKYLEPYDSSVPLEKQAFLETRDEIYVVGFNGNIVSWGSSDDGSATIGIPEGKHELQLVLRKTLYTATIDCLPGHRYVLYYVYDEKGIFITNLTGSKSRESRTTNATKIGEYKP